MTRKREHVDNLGDSEGPLEDQPLDWSEEDRDLENRKPDLGELDEDPSEL
jgi:hypothetical protein